MAHMAFVGKPTAKTFTKKGHRSFSACYCYAPILLLKDFMENKAENQVVVLGTNPVIKFGLVVATAEKEV